MVGQFVLKIVPKPTDVLEHPIDDDHSLIHRPRPKRPKCTKVSGATVAWKIALSETSAVCRAIYLEFHLYNS